MSTKQCEDMLVGKGVRPTAARILVRIGGGVGDVG